MPSPSDLTTLADVRAWLSITATTDDALIQRLITSASNYIQSWLNRKLTVTNYTKIFCGNGGEIQAFPDYPVIDVTYVRMGTIVLSRSDGVSPGYLFDEKFLYLINTRFTRGLQNINIAYSAGYAAIPEEIKQACIDLVALRYRERNRVGEVSKAIGGETVTYSQKDFPEGVRTILNNYKKVIPI